MISRYMTYRRNPSLSEPYLQPVYPSAPRTLPQPNQYTDPPLQPFPVHTNPRPPTFPKQHRLSYLEPHYPPSAIQPHNPTSIPPQAQNPIASNSTQQHPLSNQYYLTPPSYPPSTPSKPHPGYPHPGICSLSFHGIQPPSSYTIATLPHIPPQEIVFPTSYFGNP